MHDLGCTFLGVNCSQSWADFQLWERLFNAHAELKSIVEIGTGEGGFSRYLQLQAEARGLGFATFDVVQMDGQNVAGFQQADVFADPARVVNAWTSPAVLFCDGGDKPREVAVFTPLLAVGDVVVVHDWGVEVDLRHIPLELMPLHHDWCDELRSHSRAFRKAAT